MMVAIQQVQRRYLIPALNARGTWDNTRQHARLPICVPMYTSCLFSNPGWGTLEGCQ